ncbi:hypothetical protein [Mycolicibacterium septicum]|uniref:hypothetical protein n=1 Tax=Mycolicibacterium septicum TaxID=98668 RepID=UPI00235E83FF|nr:hypothetical protein [Mycolicibacterium septicum]
MASRALDARNKLASTARHHSDDPSKIDDARRDLAEAKIADYVERVLAAAPPLTDEQRVRLAELLRPVRVPIKGGGENGTA